MLIKLDKIKYTSLMFFVIVFILVLTVGTLLFTSTKSATKGLNFLGEEALETVHTSMMNALNAMNDKIVSKLKSDLIILEMKMMTGEDLYLDSNTTKIGNFTIPIMRKGGKDVSSTTSLVDDITKKTGAAATIFQFVDNKLLRISTSVFKKDGNRATGTFISPDSPIYKTIMRGETFLGKAFVVDDWYLTAYSPLYDNSKTIIGAVFVGSVMITDTVKEMVSATKMGPGYFFVYSKTGEYLIHPKHGSDKNIFELVPAFRNHKEGFIDYTSSSGIQKIAIIEYLENWDVWVGIGMSHKDIIGGLDSKLITQGLLEGLGILIIGGGLGLLLVNIINRRIKSIADTAAKVGQGDYRVNFNVQSKDALGLLSNSLNDMVASSNEMLTEINSSSESLASSATELAAIAEELVNNADDTTEVANHSANNATEVSANMDSVAAASEESATNLNMIAAATEEMGNTIQEIAENGARASSTTSEAVETTKRSQKAVSSLGDAADSIGKVTETITEISEQTNLLALNATIEAARAGEAGKGFAVVANEIKELAHQTAQATGSIRDAIVAIQTQTTTTISDISVISEIISGVDEIMQGIVTAVEEQSITTNEIVENVTQASTGISEVNESIAASSAMTNEVSNGVEQVKDKSLDVKQSSEHVQTAADDLSRLAENLSALVSKFKV